MARDDLLNQQGGGGIDQFEFTVTDAWFGESPAMKAKIGTSPIFLHLVGKTDIEDKPVLDETGFHPSYTVSDKWEVTNEGKSLKFVGSGTKQQLGKWYGRFCDEVFALTEHVANDPNLDPLYGDNHPRDAKIWIGTKWFMEEKEYEFRGLQNSFHLMPTRYLGKEGNVAPAAAVSTAAAEPMASVTPISASSNGTAAREAVEILARGASDYQTFQAAALKVPGIGDDPSLLMEIADQTNGIYAKVRS